MHSNKLISPENAFDIDNLLDIIRAENNIKKINEIIKKDKERYYSKVRSNHDRPFNRPELNYNLQFKILERANKFSGTIPMEKERHQITTIDKIHFTDTTIQVYGELNELSIDEYIFKTEFPIYFEEYTKQINNKHHTYTLHVVLKSIKNYYKNHENFKSIKDKNKVYKKYINAINTLHELDDYYEPSIIKTLDYLKSLISKNLVTSHRDYEKQCSTYWKKQLSFAGLLSKDIDEFIKDAKYDVDFQ